MLNPHLILGVEEGSDMETIRKRYKQVSKMIHPDKHKNDPSAIVLYQIVRNAYDSLKESSRKITLPVMEPQLEQKESVEKKSVPEAYCT